MEVKSDDNNRNHVGEIRYGKWFLSICFIILGITIGFYFLVSYHFDLDKSTKIGDTFGILSSLFTGLAFAGVIVSILIQQQELIETRKELKKAAEAQDKSQKALNDQLTIMSSNNRITLLDNYIQTVIGGTPDPMKNYLNEIIRKEINKVIELKEYENIFLPYFFEHTDSYSIPPNRSNYKYKISIKNNGGDLVNLVFKDIDLLPYFKFEHFKHHVNKHEWIRFIIEFDGDIDQVIFLKFKSAYTDRWYFQEMTIRIIDRVLNFSISTPHAEVNNS